MILVFNSGSSSLKFGCFEAATAATRATGVIDWSGRAQSAVVFDAEGRERLRTRSSAQDQRHAVEESLQILEDSRIAPNADLRSGVSAVGHRVVHGGTRFRASVAIDREFKAAMRELSDLAPLHNPPAMEVIEAAGQSLPAVPQVAVFDTSFFSGLPARSHIYPVPYDWYSVWGVRRFGFHGISHDYCTRRASELGGGETCGRLVICHLGNGCSATAVRDGEPVATTMGFTPLDGLMMGSRPGSIDPGILVYLQRNKGLTPGGIDEALNYGSGLLGVSGVSGDFREVERAAGEGNGRARLALDIYADRVRSAIGSLAVTLGAVDALVFTGGVGENAVALRAAVCDGLQCLGIRLDPAANRAGHGDSDIAASDSQARIWVLRTREELMIARETTRVIGAQAAARHAPGVQTP